MGGAGDVAVSWLTAGRWSYPTGYRTADGEAKGTDVDVRTTGERFSDGAVERMDDDELDAAVETRHVPDAVAGKAREVVASIELGLAEASLVPELGEDRP